MTPQVTPQVAPQVLIVIQQPQIALPMGLAAESLGISRSTLRRIIAAGKIKAIPYKCVPVCEIERYVREEIDNQ